MDPWVDLISREQVVSIGHKFDKLLKLRVFANRHNWQMGGLSCAFFVFILVEYESILADEFLESGGTFCVDGLCAASDVSSDFDMVF